MAACDRPASAEAVGGDFGARVLELVASIPPGTVLTYGDVAALIGSRSARGVGRVLALSGSQVPWWRVVRAGGLPPQGHEARALERYREEGTPLRLAPNGSWRVDLARASARM